MPAKVYLVGAGPGSPGLITVRGRELLARAEVLVYDAPCDAALLGEAPTEAERIPVGRGAGGARLSQGEINALLVERARRGRTVVRLKSGDPFMFGRGSEEAEALALAGVAFEVVPGVTAGLAAAAWAGIPITHRDLSSAVSFLIVQSGSAPADWGLDLDSLAHAETTQILYLDPPAVAPIAAELLSRGRPASTPVAVVESAGSPAQRTFDGTLQDIAERARDARPPTVAVLGAAVARRRPLAWAEQRPLAGCTIVLTRPREQSVEMASLLEEQGAEVWSIPCIAIASPESWEPLDRAVASLERFNWVVFSSANGVEHFLARLRSAGRDARALARARLAAVGPATARALEAASLKADLVPREHQAESLAQEIAAEGISGKRVLVVRAQEGRDVLPEELRRLGAEVELVPAYRTLRPAIDLGPVRERSVAGRLDAVVFASPSAVKAFAAALAPGEAPRLLERTCVAAIGPVTAEAVRALGLHVDLTPDASTGSALAEALVRRLGNTQAGRLL